MTWLNKIKQLGSKHKTPDKAFKADFIYEAFDGQLGQGQSQQLAYQIEDAINFFENPTEYQGMHRKLYDHLRPYSVIDFVGKYMEQAGLVPDPKKAKEITDAFLSAEEHIAHNTPVDIAMEAFEVSDPKPTGTVETGIGYRKTPEYSKIIDVTDAYSEEEIERLSKC